MKALIVSSENNRIAEVAAQDFPVALPLYWVDCPDDCTTEWSYDGIEFKKPEIKKVADRQALGTPQPLTAEQLRALAYRNEADPLFFKYQRGEIEKQTWLNKVQEIKARYPININN